MDQELPRLQKVLAAAGIASRRACEEMISQGRVVVNGKVVKEPGTKVNPDSDEIRVDGDPVLLEMKQKPIYVMLNKPIGVVSSVSDAHAETTVADLVAQLEARLYPVGRLDAESSGLLLLTNDGDFAYRLTHPRYHVPKIYQVRARGFVDRNAARTLSEGVELPDGRTAPADVKFLGYDAATQCTILEMTLYEGRNRQVRRMLESVGHPVKALTRIGFGSLRLNELSPGTWRKLRPEEVEKLLEMARPTPTPKKQERRIHLPFRPRNLPVSEEAASDTAPEASAAPSVKAPRTPQSRPALPPETETPARPSYNTPASRPRRGADASPRPNNAAKRPNDAAKPGAGAPYRPGNASKPGTGAPYRPGNTSRPGAGASYRSGNNSRPAPGAPYQPGNTFRPGGSNSPRPGDTVRPNNNSRPYRPDNKARPGMGASPRPNAGPGRPNSAPRPRPNSGASNRPSGAPRPNTGQRRPGMSDQSRKPKR